MWCERCQAEVACQAGPDNQHLQCATCGSDLPTAAVSKPTRDPRELLEKWAREETLDVVLPVISAKKATSPVVEVRKNSASEPSRKQPAALVSALPAAPRINRDSAPKPTEPIDGRFFEPLPPSITARVGQGVAYLGVAVLAVGSGLVLLDYFGNYTGLAPYGWLATLAGQLLMFLGVVTLISAGLEQTGADTARQLNSLTEQLLRLEQYVQQQPESVTPPVPETGPIAVDFGETPEKPAHVRVRRSA